MKIKDAKHTTFRVVSVAMVLTFIVCIVAYMNEVSDKLANIASRIGADN